MTEKESSENPGLLLRTNRFGNFSISEEQILRFLDGLIGFPDMTRFVFIEYEEPFSWLQSVDDPDLAFVVMNASHLGSDYRPVIPEKQVLPEDFNQKQALTLNIITITREPREVTANLRAPIFIDPVTKLGVQLMVENEEYSVDYPLFQDSQ